MSRRGFVLVTRPGDGLGFRLAGVRVEEVAEGEEADRLRPLLEEPNAGVVAVEEAVLRRAPEAILERAARTGTPIVFPFALPRRIADTGAARSYVGALIRRAIGFHVRLER
jgi:V/A-type H+/Na+-transporting ATPase subunit F